MKPAGICLLLSCVLTPLIALGQENLKADDYTRSEIMIPMRDGVRLDTVILAPHVATKQKLPFLFSRSPYGLSSADLKSLGPNSANEGSRTSGAALSPKEPS